MSKRLFHLLASTGLALALTAPASALAGQAPSRDPARNMALHSPAFGPQSHIPRRFSCQGAGVSPPLAWSGVPAKAKSLTLIVHDPDAPSGDWVHWVVYNLPPGHRKLKQNVGAVGLPQGAAVGTNSYQDQGYGGVCPPSGRHHYLFDLYALDTRLPAKAYDKRAALAAMHGHVLARARLVATYRKQ